MHQNGHANRHLHTSRHLHKHGAIRTSPCGPMASPYRKNCVYSLVFGKGTLMNTSKNTGYIKRKIKHGHRNKNSKQLLPIANV